MIDPEKVTHLINGVDIASGNSRQSIDDIDVSIFAGHHEGRRSVLWVKGK